MALSKALFIIALAFAFTVNAYIDHECDHDHQDWAPEYLDIEEDMSRPGEGRVLRNVEPKNIRIYPHYDLLNSAPPSFKAYIEEELVPPVIDYFQGALKLKYPVVGNLKLSSNIERVCNKAAPSILVNTGVAADYFIFYDSEESESSNLASSRYCYLATGSKRPLIATTIFNREMLLEPKGDVLLHEKNIYVTMHEMMHTFGFDGLLFELFLDANGVTRKGHIKTKSVNGITTTIIDVPPLTDMLRTHFGCPSLEGAYMENEGGVGTAGSHFERKSFLYEAMTSGSITGRRMSKFSLALLEGSGWYVPDYEYAEPFFYGQNQGCDFLEKKCSNNPIFEEFCSGPEKGCSPHGRAGGRCVSDENADGCRFYVPDDEYDCDNPDGEDFARFPELQVYGRGASSKCFTGNLNTRNVIGSRTTFCFRYACRGTESQPQLEVHVGNEKIICEREGQRAINGYYGSVDCPDPVKFCSTVGKKYCPRNCMGRGKCMGGKCECNIGFAGIDCTIRV